MGKFFDAEEDVKTFQLYFSSTSNLGKGSKKKIQLWKIS